jgi:glutathione S-transferase
MMPRLVTITFSHYCEKARWALDRAHIPYVEEGHLPLFAWVPALRAGKRRTAPSLVTASGPVNDSTDILHWVDRHGDAPPLFPEDVPEVVELEAKFDKYVGPATRRVGYHHILPTMRERLRADMPGVPRGERIAARLLARPIGRLMRFGLGIDEAGVQRSLDRVETVVAEVDRMLADGRRYLAGNRFTAADLTFASLMIPFIAPPELSDFLPLGADRPPALDALIQATRSRPAGRFVQRLYADERGRPGGAAQAA